MPEGDAAGATQCIALSNGYFLKSNPKLTGKVLFHRAKEDTETSPTAYAVVHRVDANTWTIKPGDGSTCSPLPTKLGKSADVAGIWNDDMSALYGHYHLPFSFTLRRK